MGRSVTRSGTKDCSAESTKRGPTAERAFRRQLRNYGGATRGPRKPVHARDLDTHIQRHARDCPGRRSCFLFGEQQVHSFGPQRSALYPPDAAWNCVTSASIWLFRAISSSSRVRALCATSKEFTLLRTAAARTRSSRNVRTPNCSWRRL
jgi:hypothetical protein